MQLIPSIVDTCRICRTWARNAPATRTTTRLSTRFNQCVQCDLLFYSDELEQRLQSFVILHMVDECIRWDEALIVNSKDTPDLITGMTSLWIGRFGAPAMMIWDGESALFSAEGKKWTDRHNIDLIPELRVRRHGLLNAIMS